MNSQETKAFFEAQYGVERAIKRKQWDQLQPLLDQCLDYIPENHSLEYCPLLHPNQAIYLLEYAPQSWQRLQKLQKHKTYLGSDYIGNSNYNEIAALFTKHINTQMVKTAMAKEPWLLNTAKAMLKPKLWNTWDNTPLKANWIWRQIIQHPRLGRACLVAQNYLPYWTKMSPQQGIHPTTTLCILFGAKTAIKHRLVLPQNLPTIAYQIHKLRNWNPRKDPIPFTSEELSQLHCWAGADFLSAWGLNTSDTLHAGWPNPAIIHLDGHIGTVAIHPTNISDNHTTFAIRLNQNTALVTANLYNTSNNIRQILSNHHIALVEAAHYQPFCQINGKFCNDPQNSDFHQTFATFCAHDDTWTWNNESRNPVPLIQQWLAADPSPLQNRTTRGILSARLKLREATLLYEIKNNQNDRTWIPELRQLINVLSQFCPETPCHPDSVGILL